MEAVRSRHRRDPSLRSGSLSIHKEPCRERHVTNGTHSLRVYASVRSGLRPRRGRTVTRGYPRGYTPREIHDTTSPPSIHYGSWWITFTRYNTRFLQCSSLHTTHTHTGTQHVTATPGKHTQMWAIPRSVNHFIGSGGPHTQKHWWIRQSGGVVLSRGDER